MFYRSVVLFLAAGAVTAQGPAPKVINDKIDATLRGHNEMLTQRHLENLPLSEGTVDGIAFSKGFQLGANTMQRAGDGTEQSLDGGKTLVYKYKIGYKSLGLSFDKVRFEDGTEVAKPRFKVSANGVHFDFRIKGKGEPDCKVTLDEYKFYEVQGLRVVDGEFSQEQLNTLEKVIMSYLNMALEKKKIQVEKHLQPLCKIGL